MAPLPMRVEWRCALTTHMAQSVMTRGMNLMPESSVDNWDMITRVSSKMKGCTHEITCGVSVDVYPAKKATFGSGNSTRPITLDDITCTGNEENILDCSYDSVSNCDHSEDAGVVCGAVCLNGTVRLATEDINEFYQDPNTLDDDYFIKDELARGRVEVCVEGGYGTVCDGYWNSQDASVVCSQLGFSPYGKTYMHKLLFTQLFCFLQEPLASLEAISVMHQYQ